MEGKRLFYGTISSASREVKEFASKHGVSMDGQYAKYEGGIYEFSDWSTDWGWWDVCWATEDQIFGDR